MRDKNVAAILALFFGAVGVHKFYVGRIGAGILYMMFAWTFVPALLGLIDFFVLAAMDTDEFNRRYNGSHTLPPPMVVNMLPPAPHYPPPYAPVMPPHPGMHPHAHAPSPYTPPAPGRSPLTTDQLAAELEKLNELRISGLLSEEEFAAQKARLLGSM